MRSPRSPRPSFGRAVADGARGLPEDLEVRTLLDQLPAILYVSEVGVAGRWHYVSAGVRAILGFSPEEWMRDPGLWARQMHPADRDRVFAREDQLLQPTVPDEYRMRHRDGAMVWVRDEAALVTDAQGCVRWHGVMSDITDRKLAEAELERRAEQQAAVARLGEHALEGADVAELINEALQEAARILDVEMGAVLELSFRRFLCGERDFGELLRTFHAQGDLAFFDGAFTCGRRCGCRGERVEREHGEERDQRPREGNVRSRFPTILATNQSFVLRQYVLSRV